MAKLTVLHLAGYREFTLSITARIARNILRQDHPDAEYLPVAVVSVTDDTKLEAQLELAFQYTNTIENPWWRNECVGPVEGSKLFPTRSTSVGDIVRTPDGAHYLVKGSGFEKLAD